MCWFSRGWHILYLNGENIMIKKISIISLLTISVLFSSFVVQQRKVDASVSDVLYYGAEAASQIAVDTYMFLRDSAENIKKFVITSFDSVEGSVNIDEAETTNGEGGVFINETGGYSGGTIIVIPKDSIDVNNTITYYSMSREDPALGLDAAIQKGCYDRVTQIHEAIGLDVAMCTYKYGTYPSYPTGEIRIDVYVEPLNVNFLDDSYNLNQVDYTTEIADGDLGATYSSLINDVAVNFYEFEEDVPKLPDCFDGVHNQDEAGVDCGGVCELNFGLACPPVETCADDIMNQDETGIDYGGVCGTDDPVAAPAENFTDTNQDGVDDLSGLDATGSITVASPGDADGSTYDSSLPGDISEVGETDWTGLITGYLATNPLVLLATGSSISLSGEDCTLTANVFNSDIVLDFCSVEGMVDLIGTFVLGLMTIRSVFIAMGI
jgi:hypothetical protein